MEKNIFTKRSILIGTILSVFISVSDVYNLMVIQGSDMTIDFTTGAAIYLIFWITLFNYLLKKISPKFSLSIAEMILIYIMMIVSCSIPTMGLTLYLIPLIAGTKYYANDQNNWADLFIKHLKNWTILNDNNAINWFFEGIPKGQSIPWAPWIKVLILWIPLIIALYLAMIFIMVILRKQWVENEKLNFPLTKAPISLIKADENKIFNNNLFWLGFAIPFIIGCINGLHFYNELFPRIQLATSTPIFRRTMSLPYRISFPMIGFTYFVPLPLSFSLWFFCLLSTIQQGFFNITGFGISEFLPYNAERPILGWQSLGSLFIIVIYGLWIARKQIKDVFRKGIGKEKDDSSEYEIVSYKFAFWGLVISILVIFWWIVLSGLPPFPSIFFIIFMFIIFIGITRAICEGGISTTRAPVIAPVITTSFFGSKNLGPSALGPLGLTFVYSSDVRTFVMASVANGLKILEEVKGKKKIIFGAILISIVTTLISSIWTVIYLGYKYGGINANAWFFVNGPQYGWQYIVQELKTPSGPDMIYWGFFAIGAVFTIFLQFMRMRFLWFPFHPLGFAFSTIMLTNELWFSIFLSWLFKFMILRYGGANVYEKGKTFFIGLIVGQFIVSGTWLFIDFFTGRTGNILFWI
ncbi:MAG TPA: hypothetical protein PLW95_05550 [bacterium]|nr:hypothetical protein [bacterium]